MKNLPQPEILEDLIRRKLKLYRDKLVKHCTFCNGTGVEELNEETKLAILCKKCVGLFQATKKYIYANISVEHVEFTLENIAAIIDDQCIAAFREFRDAASQILHEGNILIYRNNDFNSFGVSTMGSILMKFLVDRGVDICSVPSKELCDCFFNFSDDKERNDRLTKLIDYYASVPVLLIDDFGDEFVGKKANTFISEKFMQFFMKRKVNNKNIIFCSGMSKDAIMDKYKATGLGEMLRMNCMEFKVKCKSGKGKTSFEEKFVGKYKGKLSLVNDYMKDDVTPPKEATPPPPPPETTEQKELPRNTGRMKQDKNWKK